MYNDIPSILLFLQVKNGKTFNFEQLIHVNSAYFQFDLTAAWICSFINFLACSTMEGLDIES